MKQNFIRTTDEDTKNKLLEEGFKLISQDGSAYTFINDVTHTFEDKSKITYTNMLYI
jgi:hypothetical protein